MKVLNERVDFNTTITCISNLKYADDRSILHVPNVWISPHLRVCLGASNTYFPRRLHYAKLTLTFALGAYTNPRSKECSNLYPGKRDRKYPPKNISVSWLERERPPLPYQYGSGQ